MAYKSLRGVMIILVLLYMTLLVVVAADAGEESKVQGGMSLLSCMEQCMPICMKIKYAETLPCQQACAPGCKQLQGKGSVSYEIRKDWKNL